jgi:hypothetical protein
LSSSQMIVVIPSASHLGHLQSLPALHNARWIGQISI